MSAARSPPSAAPTRRLAGRTILQIIPRLDAGGAERTTHRRRRRAGRRRARGRWSPPRADGSPANCRRSAACSLPFPAATKNPLAMLLNVRKLARLIVAERVDLVHARSRAPAWVALGACRIAERPFVTTYHGAYGGALGAEAALQFGHGARRRRDRQFAVHRRRDRAALSRSRATGCASFRRGTDLRALLARRGRARARGAAARGLGRRAARARRAAGGAADRLEGPEDADRGGAAAQGRGSRRRALHPRRRRAGARRLRRASSTR